MRAGWRTLVAAAAWAGLAALAFAQSANKTDSPSPSPEQLRAWVKQLDAEDYSAREQATRLLEEAGEVGIEALAEGVNSASPEVAWRASESLQEIAIQGNETTLNRVVAALDKLSQNGKSGLANIAQELRTKQVKLRHDRAAAKIRSLGGRLVGGGAVAMDGGMMMAVEIMPAIAVDFGGDVVVPAALEPAPAVELPPDKPVALKALDAALARLADLLPVKIDEPELPKVEEALKPVEPVPAEVELPAEPVPPPPSEPEPVPAPEPPQAPAEDAVPADDPAPPPAEAPVAEPEAITEVIPAEADVEIADAVVVEAGFIGGPIFGGGFFVEEGAFPEAEGGLSRSLTIDQSWRGGDDGLAALRDLPSLASLSIVDAKITDASLAHIAALPNLQDLSIVNTKLSVDALLKFRKQRPSTRIFARGSAMLGIHADQTGSPCILTGVYDGSGAAEAGLQIGDQITTIDGHKIGDFGDLTIAVYAHAPGDKLKVEFLRGGETKTADVQLKPRADLEAPRR